MLGNNVNAANLTGGIDEPLNDDTYIELTPDQIAALPSESLCGQRRVHAVPSPCPPPAASPPPVACRTACPPFAACHVIHAGCLEAPP